MDLRSAFLPRTTAPRSGGVVLASAVLALPGLVVARPGAGMLLLALSLVAAAALLEGRRRAPPSPREAPRLALVATPARAAGVRPSVRWEVVERDGHRGLSMRWS